MNYRNHFFVYRPLVEESVARIEELQEEFSAVQSFVPIRNPDMKILNAYYSGRRIPRDLLEDVMHRAPKSSEESQDAHVLDVKVSRRLKDITRVAIKLILDSEDADPYFEEHRIFKKNFENIRRNAAIGDFTQPHVTLGYLDASMATNETINLAESLVGTTLGFGPTDSDVGRAYAAVHYTRPSSQQAINTPVKTLKPGTIPQALLASLQTPPSTQSQMYL